MIHYGKDVSEAYRQILIQRASASVAKFPQYAFKFDNNLLVRFNQDVEDFCEGEFSLAIPRIVEFNGDDGKQQCIAVWNFFKNWSVHVPYNAVDFIERHVKLTLELDY